jgi:hypothetical protein
MDGGGMITLRVRTQASSNPLPQRNKSINSIHKRRQEVQKEWTRRVRMEMAIKKSPPIAQKLTILITMTVRSMYLNIILMKTFKIQSK